MDYSPIPGSMMKTYFKAELALETKLDYRSFELGVSIVLKISIILKSYLIRSEESFSLGN